ncbi:MAG: hypothetical protein WBP83_05930, partial [Nitrososphaeraceae archaeon]
NEDRTELVIPETLDDKVVDTDEEANAISFATGFAGISDIEVSPYDGYVYVVSLGQGKIFKIVPTGEGDTNNAGGSVPPPPTTSTASPTVDGANEADTQEQDQPEQDDGNIDNNDNNGDYNGDSNSIENDDEDDEEE